MVNSDQPLTQTLQLLLRVPACFCTIVVRFAFFAAFIVPVTWRGSIWLDTDGDGGVDACEVIIQDGSTPVPTDPPLGSTPAPPTLGTLMVPPQAPVIPTEIRVIVEIEYMDLAGETKKHKTTKTVRVRWKLLTWKWRSPWNKKSFC